MPDYHAPSKYMVRIVNIATGRCDWRDDVEANSHGSAVDKALALFLPSRPVAFLIWTTEIDRLEVRMHFRGLA